ncbi:MAG TPA: FAD-dependent oxidoreductase [Solirubrobacteraceae bacterium]|nr:FAD-dependent oxidoreductase [Solirubrobacteraceae bacterium]
MSSQAPGPKLQVVIAGGGVAAVEAALGLAQLAGEQTQRTVLAPNAELVNRPMTVREPFAYPKAQRHELAPIVADAGAELVVDELAWVDPEGRRAHTRGGLALPYDVLVLALGGRIVPRYEHAITIDDRHLDETVEGLVRDVEEGYTKSVAFIAPGRVAWPLPLYELALMTAGRAYDMNVQLRATLITPEDSPLAIFGSGASTAVAERLARAHVDTVCSSYAEVPASGKVLINPGERVLEVERVVALPELYGPEIRGIPLSEYGFIRTGRHSEVLELDGVFAAGDCVDFPIKHGGLASQEADAAAEAIAARAGADVEPQPFHPEIRGMLLTDGKPLYLCAKITGGHGFSSEVSEQPLWSPPSKISSKYLAPYLESRERAGTGRA